MSVAAAPTAESYRQRAPHPARVQGGSRPRAFREGLPVVSVVSICRNAERVLERCIESVAAQDYPNIEFIIFDGASTDGTLDILRRHDGCITSWVSEPDAGRADGFNKALARATGDYLLAVMADDWIAPDFISAGVAALQRAKTDYVIGDCMLHGEDGALLYRRPGDPHFEKGLRYWMTVNSPSFVVRRSMLDEIGLFSDISVASDYDWFLRAHVAGYKGAYDPSMAYHFRTGGVSTQSAFKAYRENMAIALKYGAPKAKAMRVYTGVVIQHFSRLALQKLLPARVVLSLRRSLQKGRAFVRHRADASRT